MCRLSLAIVVGLLCAAPVSAAPVPDKVPELVRKLRSGKPGERIVAAEMLGDLGPAAADAIPALIEVIHETPIPDSERGNPRTAAINGELLNATWNALSRIGPKAVPTLTKLLSNDSAAIRGRAALALKAIGPDAADAVPALAKLLRDDEYQWVCLNAIQTLAAIGPKAEDAIPALVKAVLDPKPREVGERGTFPLRAEAAKALVAIGPKARPVIQKEVIPAIEKVLKNADENGTVFEDNTVTLWPAWPVWVVFGEDAEPLVSIIANRARRLESGWYSMNLLKLGPSGHKALVELLTDKDAGFRKNIIEELGFVFVCRTPLYNHPDVTPIIPQVIPFLLHKDYETRVDALDILSSVSSVSPEAQKAALPLLDDIDFMKTKYKRRVQLGDATHFGQWAITFCGTSAIPKLLEFLKADDEQLHEWAANALSNMRGPVVVEKLLPVWRDLAAGNTKNRAITKAWAASLVARITLDPKDIEALVPFLKSNEAKARAGTARTLGEFQTLAKPHLKNLLPLLKDEEVEVRQAAAWAIDNIDPANPEAAAALAKWLVDFGGVQAMNPTGPVAKEFAPAIPSLIKGLKSEIDFDRYRACDVICRIGPKAKDVVPTLIALLKRVGDPNFREAYPPITQGGVLRLLSAMGPEAKDAVPLLLRQMAVADDLNKTGYLLCLADIGPEAKEAISDLKELLIDPNPDLRLLAACALAKIENDSAAYHAIFRRRLSEPSNWSNRGAAGVAPLVFTRIAKDNLELVSVVLRIGISEFCIRSDERSGVWRVLIENASAAKPVLTELLKSLDTIPVWCGKREAIRLLGAMGPDAKDSLPKLRELVEKADFETAVAAKIAIEKIEAKK